jgi:hypothetical protein
MKYDLHRYACEPAEAALRPIIKYWIVELMDCGGTNPDATHDFLWEEEPDLCEALGAERVFALCEEIHGSEELFHSDWYQVRFDQFNKQFFDDRLPSFRVRVVYDVPLRMKEAASGDERSHLDMAGRQIMLAMTQVSSQFVECQLIHHMAHVATKTSTDVDPSWLEEMKRLRSLGAPVIEEFGGEQ